MLTSPSVRIGVSNYQATSTSYSPGPEPLFRISNTSRSPLRLDGLSINVTSPGPRCLRTVGVTFEAAGNGRSNAACSAATGGPSMACENTAPPSTVTRTVPATRPDHVKPRVAYDARSASPPTGLGQESTNAASPWALTCTRVVYPLASVGCSIRRAEPSIGSTTARVSRAGRGCGNFTRSCSTGPPPFNGSEVHSDPRHDTNAAPFSRPVHVSRSVLPCRPSDAASAFQYKASE